MSRTSQPKRHTLSQQIDRTLVVVAQRTSEALDKLRGEQIDGGRKRIGRAATRPVSEANTIKRFMRSRRHIRGTAQYGRHGSYLTKTWDDALVKVFPEDLPNCRAYRQAIATRFSGLRYNANMTDLGEIFDDTALHRVFEALDRTYYAILDYKLFSKYEEVAVGWLSRSNKKLFNRLAGMKGRKDTPRRALTVAAGNIEHAQHGVESFANELSTAVAFGLIGGLGGADPMLRNPALNHQLHRLPCFTTLMNEVDEMLERRQLSPDDRDDLIEALLVAVFRTWYFPEPDSRRVERRLLRLRQERERRTERHQARASDANRPRSS